MKKIILISSILIISFCFVSCPSAPPEDVDSTNTIEKTTFKEVSQPYLDKYGEPDLKTTSGNDIIWEWDTEEKLIQVTFFEDTIYNTGWKSYETSWKEFHHVSQPYLDKYGPPEGEIKYDSGDYHTVDWWWYSKGFEVTFIDSPYDDIRGWMVESTYTFEPI